MSQPDLQTVAQNATEPGVLPPSGLRLLGLFGTDHARRALILGPGGDVQRLGQDQCAAIGTVRRIDNDSVTIEKDGFFTVLRMPA